MWGFCFNLCWGGGWGEDGKMRDFGNKVDDEWVKDDILVLMIMKGVCL